MNIVCRPQREVVAQGPFCTVERCTCGTLHVALGALTIRLAPEVIASVWSTLGAAVARITAPDERGPALFDAVLRAARAEGRSS